jgi:hypothetical protein
VEEVAGVKLTDNLQETCGRENCDTVKRTHDQQILVTSYQAIGAPNYGCLRELVAVRIAASLQCPGYLDQDCGQPEISHEFPTSRFVDVLGELGAGKPRLDLLDHLTRSDQCRVVEHQERQANGFPAGEMSALMSTLLSSTTRSIVITDEPVGLLLG